MTRSNQFTIRKAEQKDLDSIKIIADANKDAIGFVLRPALAEAIQRRWVLVAEGNEQLVGFANYRHRQDQQTTLYEICVAEDYRGNGMGKALLNALVEESRRLGKTIIRLKCPAGNKANDFYDGLGFVRVGLEQGKRRKLIHWERKV
jgi:ribosomal protein S18 acetylase RimI-like enzyme